MKITKQDPFTGKYNTLDLPITATQIQEWKSGVLIQKAFAHLTPDQREFLKTGITAKSWHETFGEKQ